MKMRSDYMSGKCSYREYYAQFVTPDIRKLVAHKIGTYRILKSRDEHLNDIPLNLWDDLAGGMRTQLCRDALKAAGDGPTLAGAVCILKEAAKQLAESIPA